MQSDPTGPPPGQRRTAVFIDYQNMYRSARDAYGWTSEVGVYGNFRPYGLGRQMVRDPDHALTQVRVYTGIHTPQRNAAENGSMQRRIASWVASAPDVVQVFPSPLNYPRNRPAQEKGVDVELAIDIVAGAIDDSYDVLVLASGDTDLVPALCLVASRYPTKTIITVGMAPIEGREGRAPQPLDLPGSPVQRRFVTRLDFDRIVERTNFYESTSDQRNRVPSERWKQIARRLP